MMVFVTHSTLHECPDCGKVMKKFFVDKDRPWCEHCDVYWERIGSMWCKTLNARKLYDAYVKSLAVHQPEEAGVA